MKRIVNDKIMKQMDQYTINEIGVSSLELMENAAMSVVDYLYDSGLDLKNILILCGSGNNGGDGIAIGRILKTKGINCDIYTVGSKGNCSVDNLNQKNMLNKLGYCTIEQIKHSEYTIIIDSLFGVGLSRNIEGEYYKLIEWCNSLDAYKIAVDVPSGINSTTGEVMGIAFKADVTVTFAKAKLGCILYPGADYSGKLVVKDIGIDDSILCDKNSIYSLEKNDLNRIIKSRISNSNKGTYGKILVVAGSKKMSGAAYFAAKSAYKSGAGLVRIFSSIDNKNVLQTMLPEAIFEFYDDSDEKKRVVSKLIESIRWCDAVIIGPGLSTSLVAKILVIETLKNIGDKPCIVDADAINIISEDINEFMKYQTKNLIFTPHVGEMARLTKKSISEIKSNIIDECVLFARNNSCVCVLKDARTIISDGNKTLINTTGNNGMATAGMGDVLTGIICAVSHNAEDLILSVAAGVYIHGLAGDLMADKLNRFSLMASDMFEGLENVFKEII